VAVDETQVTKMIADTLQWAIGQAHCPAILNLEIVEGAILFDTIDGGAFSLTVENIDL
jgi:hypothetical protein